MDVWNRTTSDMLLVVPVIYSAGDAGAPAVNIGEMYNEGIDFALRMMRTLEILTFLLQVTFLLM